MVEVADTGPRGRLSGKSASAYRTISEVSEELDIPQHVLRFWETKFSQVRPLKRGGGRRYYRPEDVGLLRSIRRLLYQEGYTIKGVQRLLREGRALEEPGTEEALGPKQPPSKATEESPAVTGRAEPPDVLPPGLRAELTELLVELRRLRAALAEKVK